MTPNDRLRARIWIVVAAAGSGTRFGATLPKQYADLGGQPVLARTLDRLASIDAAGILVALAPGDTRYDALVGGRPGVEAIHCGGATRGATVGNALAALALRCADQDWVLVHDAVRPCVPREALARLVRELATDPVGGLLALPVADTLKREADAATPPRVLRSEARRGWWLAQTPQMFRYRLLVRAYGQPGALDCTDDAEAIERFAPEAGAAMPRLVHGSSDNVKITQPGDLTVALALLGRGGCA